MDLEEKSLSELRVVDLKRELEKRGLDKNGVKAVLIERLSKALEEEGLSPDTHLFEISGGRSAKGDESMSSDREIDKSTDGGDDHEAGSEQDGGGDERTNDADNDGLDDKEEINEDHLLLDRDFEDDNADLISRNEDDLDLHDEANKENDADQGANGNTDHDDEEKLIVNSEETERELREELENHEEVHNDAENGAEVEKQEKRKEGDEENEKTQETDAETAQASDADKEAQSIGAEGEKKSDGSESKGSANLWVSNLSQNTKATDLRRLFSRHGKLVGAKIVTSARTPGARCYGYVTMANADDADRCIRFLHKVELHSRIISVERAKDDATGPLNPRTTESKSATKEESASGTPKDDKRTSEHRDRERDRDRERERERDRHRDRRPRHHDSIRPPRKRTPSARDILSFAKIKEERERQRARDHERRQRELAKQRRDHEEEIRIRERERRQRLESERLEKEKLKLRLEKEKLEREREELIRLERERQRLERERLEWEREELRSRKKQLSAVVSNPQSRSGNKRPSDDKTGYQSKRPNVEKDVLLEPPPPPRFGGSDRQRDRFPRSGGKYERRVDDRRTVKEDTSRSAGRYDDGNNWAGNGAQYKSYSGGYNREVWTSSRADSHWSAQDPGNSVYYDY